MISAVDSKYFNDLENGTGWVRFKTKVKMFFSGYEMDELRGAEPQVQKIEPNPQSFSAPQPAVNVSTTPSVEPSSVQPPSFDHFPNREEACIPKDTIIEGSVSTKSNLLICGFVRGDVVSENIVTVDGKVEGNIQAKSVYIKKGTVDGHINCVADISISEMSMINGNIDAQSLDCSGEIKGDIKTSKSVTLKSGAFITGNISTKSINMQDGSVLRGNVEMPTERMANV